MKPSAKSIFVFLFLGIFWISSCSQSDKIPQGILPLNKMSSVMLDMELADSYNDSYYANESNGYPTDRQERLKVFYQQILELHHTDTATFFKSFRFYTNKPDLLKKLYKSMEDSLAQKTSLHQRIEEKRRRQQEQKRNEDYIPVTPWEKHVQAWYKFFDSVYQKESPVIYPWGNKTLGEILKEQKKAERERKRLRNYIPVTPWEKHVQDWHAFFQSVHEQESRIRYPWGYRTLRELVNDRKIQHSGIRQPVWKYFSNTWHSFSDSIHRQSSRLDYPWQEGEKTDSAGKQ